VAVELKKAIAATSVAADVVDALGPELRERDWVYDRRNRERGGWVVGVEADGEYWVQFFEAGGLTPPELVARKDLIRGE